MTPSNYQMRRATVDDLSLLRKLWQRGGLPIGALEKRLTEFQVIETADGTLLGSIGLQIEAQQGKIHSEVYSDPAQSDDLRYRLWERVQSVARNYGLWRIWVHDDGVVWQAKDFQPPEEQALQKLPRGFGEPDDQHWLTLKLRDEIVASISLEQELELFRESHKQLTEKVLRQARALRMVAGSIAVIGLLLVLAAVWYVLRHLHVPARL